VADHDERREAEPPSALDDLRHAVDRHDALLVRTALGLGVVPSHQICNPPSRAPSATALTRPWYSRPPRSNTTRSIPAAFAFSARARPTRLARADLSPPWPPVTSETAASVAACPSSTSCA